MASPGPETTHKPREARMPTPLPEITWNRTSTATSATGTHPPEEVPHRKRRCGYMAPCRVPDSNATGLAPPNTRVEHHRRRFIHTRIQHQEKVGPSLEAATKSYPLRAEHKNPCPATRAQPTARRAPRIAPAGPTRHKEAPPVEKRITSGDRHGHIQP